MGRKVDEPRQEEGVDDREAQLGNTALWRMYPEAQEICYFLPSSSGDIYS